MSSDTTTQLIQMLTYILIPIIIAVFGLAVFLIYLHFKEKKANKIVEDENNQSTKVTNKNTQNRQSIFNFMEFETVTDNMIVQKNGNRYLMVVECQGINYDLMSGVEKTSVEEGFVQFLNTLRYPIQIYIQTRSINLESSLIGYREKVKDVEIELRNMQMQYEQMRESGEYSDVQLKRAFYEVTKQSNLYEYGKSVLQDTERMSLNKNILNKKYYITTPILFKLINSGLYFSKIVMMVQKEVGERFTSTPGKKEYGALTVLLRYYFDTKKEFLVSREEFIPKPNVDSIVVSFKPKETKEKLMSEEFFQQIVHDSFQFKRKTLRNNLKKYDLKLVSEVLEKYNLDLSVRAEQLDYKIFVDIANKLYK